MGEALRAEMTPK
jgi:hypothetical protein